MKTYKFGNTKIYFHKNELPDSIKFPKEVAIDTETTGLNLTRDRLCLMQIGFSQEECHLIKFDVDFFEKQNSSKKLKELFKNDSIQKIFHFGRFDLSIIKKFFGINCNNIFCTKIASKLVRTYTDRHGLKDLCKELLEVDLSKIQQSSDWSQENLSENQIKYASKDVIYLFELKNKLEFMLQREKRTEVSKKLFEFLKTRIELDFMGWQDVDIFSQ